MFNLNTNSKLATRNLPMKQQRIRKSASLLAFKTLPVESIVFNPSEFHVGESRISRLPERTLPRRNSLATLPRTEKTTPLKDSKQVELTLLLKLNQKLAKQNSELKHQLELYKKISRNSSKTKSSHVSHDSSKAEFNLKNIVVEKINRTKCSSRLASDNETGLYSSKQLSYNNELETINDMYDNFIKRAARPSILQYQENLKKFFNEFEQTFIKLKYLFESVSKQQQASNPASFSQSQSLLQTINEICQVKIQKQKAAKYPGLQKGRSRCKVERQPTREKVHEKEDVLELLSPDEVIERFEKYIEKVVKSQRIMKSLKSSLIVRKFTKKLSEV